MAEITISITGETTDLRFQQIVKALGFQLCVEGNPEVKRIRPIQQILKADGFSGKKRGRPKGWRPQIGHKVPEPIKGIFNWQVVLKNKHTRDVKNFIMEGHSKDEVETAVFEKLGKNYDLVSIAPEVDSGGQG
jgi:hypothetical protein